MPIIELKIFKYECDECSQDWMMVNPGENRAFFCPYCGKQQPVQSLFGEYTDKKPNHYKPKPGAESITERRVEDKRRPGAVPWDETYERRKVSYGVGVIEVPEIPKYTINQADEECIEPSVDEVLHPITIVDKKKPARIEAEDRMTHKVCEEGWWNPITKECQGEGNGHNVVDNDDDS
tara:strand:- start:102 stop:635 length:534 start_codon:yes stop_codon:yes gene_type:complete